MRRVALTARCLFALLSLLVTLGAPMHVMACAWQASVQSEREHGDVDDGAPQGDLDDDGDDDDGDELTRVDPLAPPRATGLRLLHAPRSPALLRPVAVAPPASLAHSPEPPPPRQ